MDAGGQAGNRDTGDRRQWKSRVVDQAREGFFLVRLVRGGPLVAAHVRRLLGEWLVEIAGCEQGTPHADPAKASRVLETCNYGQEITEDEFRRHAANPPSLNGVPLDPRKPVDLTARPSLF